MRSLMKFDIGRWKNVCYFDTATHTSALSLSLSFNLHMSSYGIIWYFFLCVFAIKCYNLLSCFIPFGGITFISLICSSFISKERCSSGLIWAARGKRWTMFIGKPRVLTSNTRTSTFGFMWNVRLGGGQEVRRRCRLGRHQSSPKSNLPFGQVLNPVVLTTFCFHSIIFCFGVVLMEGREQQSVAMVFGCCSWSMSWLY